MYNMYMFDKLYFTLDATYYYSRETLWLHDNAISSRLQKMLHFGSVDCENIINKVC